MHRMLKLTKIRVLIATIRQLGGCPCPRCLIPTAQIHNLGTSNDRQQRTTLVRSDVSRSPLVATARNFIYQQNYGVDSTRVESLLKPDSWVPSSVSMSMSIFTASTYPLIRTFCPTALARSDSTCLSLSSSTSCTSLNSEFGVCSYFTC
jgi:hypothetical protein